MLLAFEKEEHSHYVSVFVNGTHFGIIQLKFKCCRYIIYEYYMNEQYFSKNKMIHV